MRIIFGSDDVKSAFLCKLHDLGLNNVDPGSLSVSVKALRDGSGGAEAEVDFTPYVAKEATKDSQMPEKQALSDEETEKTVDSEAGDTGDQEEGGSFFLNGAE